MSTVICAKKVLVCYLRFLYTHMLKGSSLCIIASLDLLISRIICKFYQNCANPFTSGSDYSSSSSIPGLASSGVAMDLSGEHSPTFLSYFQYMYVSS